MMENNEEMIRDRIVVKNIGGIENIVLTDTLIIDY